MMTALILSVMLSQPADDWTAVYSAERATLGILEGSGGKVLVAFTAAFRAGNSISSCSCFMAGTRQGAIAELSGEAKVTLAATNEELVFRDWKESGCCGASGAPPMQFSRATAKKPPACTVKAPKAFFRASDEGATQLKAYLVAGDRVAVLDFLPDNLLPARYEGARSITVARIRKKDLSCDAAPPAAPASPPGSTR